MENNDKIAENNVAELNDTDLEKVSGGVASALAVGGVVLGATVLTDPFEDKVGDESQG